MLAEQPSALAAQVAAVLLPALVKASAAVA
jgi:hypothetical protein